MSGVLLDLTQIPLERTGVGIYAVNYVRQLKAVETDQAMHFLIFDDDSELLAEARSIPGAAVITLNARIFRRFVFRVLIEQLLIPYLAITRSMHAVHSLHYSFPLLSLGRFKRIVTVCDMSFFLFPELHVPVKRLFFQFFIRRLPMVDGLLFISNSTMRDFDAYFPRCRALKAVVHLGADLAHLQAPPSASVRNDLQRRFEIDKFILYLGTIEPRKNILGLIKAFEQCVVAFPDLKLVIAGKIGWDCQNVLEYLNASPCKRRIVLTGYVNEAEKHALLKSALLFAYVSFYEGFGIPVLEGMAAGVATVTSNVSSMPEVAGDGALLVDPNDVGQIAQALTGLLESREARELLVGRGLTQSRLFTWDSMTRKSVAFYRRLLVQPDSWINQK